MRCPPHASPTPSPTLRHHPFWAEEQKVGPETRPRRSLFRAIPVPLHRPSLLNCPAKPYTPRRDGGQLLLHRPPPYFQECQCHRALRGPSSEAASPYSGPPGEASFLTGARLAPCHDKVGPRFDDQLLGHGTPKEHHTDGRCRAAGGPGLPRKRSLFEDRKTRLGQSTFN